MITWINKNYSTVYYYTPAATTCTTVPIFLVYLMRQRIVAKFNDIKLIVSS